MRAPDPTCGKLCRIENAGSNVLDLSLAELPVCSHRVVRHSDCHKCNVTNNNQWATETLDDTSGNCLHVAYCNHNYN